MRWWLEETLSLTLKTTVAIYSLLSPAANHSTFALKFTKFSSFIGVIYAYALHECLKKIKRKERVENKRNSN